MHRDPQGTLLTPDSHENTEIPSQPRASKSLQFRMAFASGLFDLITCVCGGTLFIALCVCSVFCGLYLLLSISNENPQLFRTIRKVMSYAFCLFGLFLLFRSLLLPFLLAVWWLVIINDILPAWRVHQFAVAIVISACYWFWHITTTNETFLLKIGDFTIFLVVPFVVVLVQLSQGAETLGGNSPVIPLQKFLGMLSEILATIFPDYRVNK